MFKRESEQPVKNSFEENNEKKKRRPLRERLSSIPVRRRIEAVILAVVTVMASLSIDWSTLFARAAGGYGVIQSGQKISTLYQNTSASEGAVTILEKATIEVKKPSTSQSVTCSWKVYQNIKNIQDRLNPEAGVLVDEGSKTITNFANEYEPCEADFEIALYENETAAVVFTLTSSSGDAITYRTYNGSGYSHFATSGGVWGKSPYAGECAQYGTPAVGTSDSLETVSLSGLPTEIALTAGGSYDFSEVIKKDKDYYRDLELTSDKQTLIPAANIDKLKFTVADDVEDGGVAKITVGGAGVEPKEVTVNVVSFAMNYPEKEGKVVLDYTGDAYTPELLYTAKCGEKITPLYQYFTTSFTGPLTDDNPLNAGEYTMTVTGKGKYAGVSYSKNISIAKVTLTADMFSNATVTVKNGVITEVTGAEYNGKALTINTDFTAEITKTEPEIGKISYTIAFTGMNNYQGEVEYPKNPVAVTEGSGVSLDSIVGRIEFEESNGTYDATEQTPGVKFIGIDGETDISGKFTNKGENPNYKIKYNRVKQGTNDPDDNLDYIVDAGEYTATVYGLGIYEGSHIATSQSAPFVLNPVSFDGKDVTVSLKEKYFEYSDSLVIKPEVTGVTYTDSKGKVWNLAAEKDYVLKSQDYSRTVGTHTVYIEGCGNYEGEAAVEYTVFPSLLKASVSLDGKTNGSMDSTGQTALWNYVWTHNVPYEYKKGEPIVPKNIKVNINNKVIDVGAVDVKNNINATTEDSKAYFIITLPEEYASKKIKVEFTIKAKLLPANSLDLGNLESKPYALGDAIELNDNEYSVKDGGTGLTKYDYDISYENNVNAGIATITATGKRNYSGTVSKTFEIKPIDITDNHISISVDDQVFNTSGPTEITDMSKIKIKYTDMNGGTHDNVFTSDDFTIKKYNNNKATWIGEGDDGPQPEVILEGKRNLSGEVTVKFKILRQTLEGLTWTLSTDPTKTGTLGDQKTIDLTKDYGYVVDFAPNLPGISINLFKKDGSSFDDYIHQQIIPSVGNNTISVEGKGNYRGSVYKFTFAVRRLDISSDDFDVKQLTDGSADELPTFALTYKGEALEKDDYDEATNAVATDGKYKAGEYTVTFTGKGSYTGSRTKKFTIGKPFNAENVFVTMYGPNGTGTVDGENRLTYFGDNDPYFILTSDKETASSTIVGPTYKDGAYGKDGDYEITFSPSDAASKHKVGTEVTVTFKAKEGGSTWYNPKNSNGVTYKYTVVPGAAGSDSTYGNLATGLSIYTAATANGGTPNADDKKDFIKYTSTVGAYGGVIEFRGFDFKYKYTTEGIDPDIHIYYDTAAVDKACATQSTAKGTPELKLESGISYFKPYEVRFDDPNLFTVNKDSVSASDTDRNIVMTPVDGGWLASLKLRATYDFEPASLSDATIAFNPTNAEYTYSKAPVALNYAVTIGKSTLNLGSDYKVEGYGTYSKDELSIDTITKIKNKLNDPSTTNIGDALKEFDVDSFSTSKPENAGTYVLVIGPGSGNNYKGYNIAKFSIATATFTAELAKSDFYVPYKGNKNAPDSNDLKVTGVDGKPLVFRSEDTTKDGYKIEETSGANQKPDANAKVTIVGTGNYKGCTREVDYKVVADIEAASPAFSPDNLSLKEHTSDTNCLVLRLENDGNLPFIGDTAEKFDLSTLTLSDGSVKLTDLSAAVAGVGSGDSLTTIGKKKITVTGDTGSPVTGKQTYYVEVFGDIGTADITLEANGARVSGTSGNMIPYTGQAIKVNPVVSFRNSILTENDYSITSNGGVKTYTEVNAYEMTLAGNHGETNDGKYYIGTPKINFSIVYDLQNGVEIVYKEADGSYPPLSRKSFGYTGSSIGDAIRNSVIVRVKGKPEKVLSAGQNQHYILEFANDTDPGTNTATATINPTGKYSINSQTVHFSIGGSTLTADNCTITIDPSTFPYDGSAKTPNVGVTYIDGGRELVLDSDYMVTYSNNINVPASGAAEDQKPSVTVTGINGKYVGTITKTFDITAKKLTASDVDFPDVPFGGSDASGNLLPATPTITVTSDGKTLVEGTDYEISYPTKQADETVGQYFTKAKDTIYTIKVTGKGNYSGEVTKTAKQLSGTLNSSNIIIDPSQPMTSVYNGRKVTFGSTGPVIRNGNSTLRYGVDYSIEIPEIINAGSYDIKITALSGGYYYDNGSSKTFSYTVTPRPIEGNEGAFVTTLYDPKTGNVVSDGAGFAFTGEKIEPMVRLVDTGVTPDTSVVNNIWTNNTSLSVNPMMNGFNASYGDNKLAGEKSGSVTLTASGNYTGTITKYFNIGTDINNVTLSYDKTSADYDGTPKSQNITVSYNGQTLTAGTAYQSPIAYTWKGGSTQTPTEVGEYTPIIKGRTDGGFYGEKQGSTFRIIAKNKSQDIEIRFNGRDGEVEAGDYVCHYNGKQQKPSITVYDTSVTPKAAIPSENYTVTYGNNINVGSGYVYVTLKGNYTGSAQEVFFIDPCDISNMTFAFAEGENGVIKNIPESSFPYVPLFKLTGLDDNGEEFVLSYADSRLKQYLVIPEDSKAKKPGKGSLKVIGTGNLEGTTNSFDYEIYGRLSESNVSVKAPVYTGTKKDPEVTVTFAGQTLVKDEDYSLRVVSSDQTGQAGGDVIVKGLGYFSGNVYVKYGEASDVSTLTLRGYSQQYVYSGRFAGPEESAIYAADSEGNQVIPADKLECTFTSSVDKEACVSANATVTITSKATLDDGTVVAGPSATYKIVQRNISSCDIRQLTSDNYTGKGLTPPISVSYDRKTYSGTVVTGHDVMALVSGRDYGLSYRNNVNPGTAEVTVTGKGNYTGTKRFMFTIKVVDMGAVAARQSGGNTVVTWTARPHVTGYRVLYNTNGMEKIETKGTTMTLSTVPSVVGVQAYVKDSTGNVTYGTPKYVAVTR